MFSDLKKEEPHTMKIVLLGCTQGAGLLQLSKVLGWSGVHGPCMSSYIDIYWARMKQAAERELLTI
jgi:hypothetical protein